MLHWTTVCVHLLLDYVYILALCLLCRLLVPLQIGQGYPHEAPKVKCETKVRTSGVQGGECSTVVCVFF